MSRREIVLLVSRAIALLLVIPSVIGLVLMIPTAIVTASMRASLIGPASSGVTLNLLRVQGAGLLASLLNVGLHVMAAIAFWQCGPVVERMLLPSGSAQPPEAVS